MNFIKFALNKLNEHKYEPFQEFRLCAIIVRGGNILSIGFNGMKKHSLIEHFKAKDWVKMHAECDAILRARRKIDLRGAKMIVVRKTFNNEIACAKPCQMCEDVIKLYGIKKVLYTIDNTSHGIMKL